MTKPVSQLPRRTPLQGCYRVRFAAARGRRLLLARMVPQLGSFMETVYRNGIFGCLRTIFLLEANQLWRR